MTGSNTSIAPNDTTTGDLPVVTIVIPCLNEAKYIESMLLSVVGGDYPRNKLEVLVMDGGSSDGTCDIVTRFAQRFPTVRLENNPDKFKPHALNRGIRLARGEVIIRMDAHCTYASTYVSMSVSLLLARGVDNVGGLRHTVVSPMSLFGRCLVETYSNRYAAGNATYRTGAATERSVDTVFGGCYRRELFDRIGYFDERLLRGQDREFNARLLKSGGKILFSPEIECWYYARGSLFKHLRYMFTAGMVPFVVNRIVGYHVTGWRNLVPLGFLGLLVIMGGLSIFHPVAGAACAGALALHLLAGVLFSIRPALTARSVGMLFALPALFFSSHLAYGVGSMWGLIRPVGATEWGQEREDIRNR